MPSVGFRALAGLFALVSAIAAPAPAQQPTPPQTPLWRVDDNGNAIQNDLGFILPPRFRQFERKGFTSTRPDGASVMTWYESADGLELKILLQLRVDVRGIPLPGADGVERNWRLVKFAANAFYFNQPGIEPETLVEQRIGWGGGDSQNAMMEVRRFAVPDGAEIQALWYRNIGMWAVLVIASGPEARRADIEAVGRAVMSEMPWPRAPLGAELRAVQPRLLETLRDCRDLDRSGTGRPFTPQAALAGVIGLTLTAHFGDRFPGMPHPAHDASPYCRVERFREGQRELVALAWRGEASATWQARWAFMVVGTGTLYQFESPLPVQGLPAETVEGVSRLVQLTVSSDRAVLVRQTFTDWPSYVDAKAAVLRSIREGGPPVVEASNPPGNMLIQVGGGALQEAPQPPSSGTP